MPDTIAAIATPQLPSAIGILRLSGPDTRRILDVVFSPAHGGLVSGQAPRRMVLGDLHDRQGRIIDSALAVLFPGPHSYTGEDCAEIHCHGSPVVLNEGLDALFAQGARQAKGGEFTQRAFLNGRMDLIQAEAVADLIDAESPAAARNAVGQLEGRLSRGVGEIYGGLMEVVSRFYAVVDYPDEDAIATATAVPRQLVILNKTDLPAGVEPAALSQRFGQLYPLSAATGEGVDALCRAVEALYPAGRQAQGELLTNARQADAVARSLEAVRSARRALENGMTPDAVLTDAEAALEALGELNGKRIREDLVQTIFSRFCVGK